MHAPASLSRPLPPPTPWRARHPLDVDPLDFSRRLWRPAATTCEAGDPPPDLAGTHRPAALDAALRELRERLCEPVRRTTVGRVPAVLYRGVLQFHPRTDGTVVGVRLELRAWGTVRNHLDPPGEIRLDPLLDDAQWTTSARAVVERAIQADAPFAPGPDRAYVEWSVECLRRILVHEGLWREPTPDAAEALGFDPTLLAIARRIRTRDGRRATLRAYNLAARHRVEFVRLAADNPSLVHLYAALRGHPGFPRQGEPIARLREWLAARGISNALWRRLAAPGRGDTMLPGGWVGLGEPERALQALAVADALGPEHDPPDWLQEAVLTEASGHEFGLLPLLVQLGPALRRIAILHARATDAERAHQRAWTPPVIGRLAAGPPADPRSLRRASWVWFERHALDGDRAQSLRPVHWPVPFAALEINGHDVVALADTFSLRDEGLVMRHCIVTYASHCVAGDWLVCSIRSRADAEARWTAAYTRDERGWRLAEVRGAGNSPATDAAKAVAGRVEAWLRDAHGGAGGLS